MLGQHLLIKGLVIEIQVFNDQLCCPHCDHLVFVSLISFIILIFSQLFSASNQFKKQVQFMKKTNINNMEQNSSVMAVRGLDTWKQWNNYLCVSCPITAEKFSYVLYKVNNRFAYLTCNALSPPQSLSDDPMQCCGSSSSLPACVLLHVALCTTTERNEVKTLWLTSHITTGVTMISLECLPRCKSNSHLS